MLLCYRNLFELKTYEGDAEDLCLNFAIVKNQYGETQVLFFYQCFFQIPYSMYLYERKNWYYSELKKLTNSVGTNHKLGVIRIHIIKQIPYVLYILFDLLQLHKLLSTTINTIIIVESKQEVGRKVW